MYISEIIKKLQELQTEEGDLWCCDMDYHGIDYIKYKKVTPEKQKEYNIPTKFVFIAAIN